MNLPRGRRCVLWRNHCAGVSAVVQQLRGIVSRDETQVKLVRLLLLPVQQISCCLCIARLLLVTELTVCSYLCGGPGHFVHECQCLEAMMLFEADGVYHCG